MCELVEIGKISDMLWIYLGKLKEFLHLQHYEICYDFWLI